MMTCNVFIEAYLATLRSGFNCIADKNGRLSIVTPYMYPDHDFIELFVREKDGAILVSDHGETLRQLDTLGMDVCRTPNLLFAVKRIADGFGVRVENGVLAKRGPVDESGSMIFDVLSSIKLIASLIYGNRSYEPAGFDYQVAEFISDHELEFTPAVKVEGKTGAPYRVSFEIQTPKGAMLLQTISPRTTGGVRNKINSTFRMWHDVGDKPKYHERKISLLNDDGLSFKNADIRLLKEVSNVFRWSNRVEMIGSIK